MPRLGEPHQLHAAKGLEEKAIQTRSQRPVPPAKEKGTESMSGPLSKCQTVAWTLFPSTGLICIFREPSGGKG